MPSFPEHPARRLIGPLLALALVSALPGLAARAAQAAQAQGTERLQPPAVIPRHDLDLDDLARRIHDLVNAERTARGLAPLERDARLDGVAAGHSQDMAEHGFFDHASPNGDDPTARGKRRGYVCRKVRGMTVREGIGENIFQGALYRKITMRRTPAGTSASYDWLTPEELAVAAVTGWMDSPGHRANILTREYDRAGLGIAVARDGRVYVTQDFC
jgi:uncharacterized protein YkwD